MNCADVEILLCDAMDGTLSGDAKAQLERHLASCAACAELARDAQAAVAFMERAEEVEPPPELMTRILFELPPAHQARARKGGSVLKQIKQWFQPVLQPRFAMGFAMTLLSISLLARFVGVSPKDIGDLTPAKVWRAVDDRVYRTWQRSVKAYENLRFVYEIQNQLRDWTQREQETKGRAASMDEQRRSPAGAAAQPSTERPGAQQNEKPK